MPALRNRLENELRKLEGVDVALYKDTNLMCVYYGGKEFAHFQDDNDLDIRLSQKFIKRESLTPIHDSKYHPNRSRKSRWMEIRFKNAKQVDDLIRLIKRLIKEELAL